MHALSRVARRYALPAIAAGAWVATRLMVRR